jgi:hypothetical protein
MIFAALQAFEWRATAGFSRGRRQWLLSWLPNRCGRFDAHRVLQAEFRNSGAECCAISITGVGQNYARRNLLFDRLRNLLQSNLGLGLELNLFGNPGLPATLRILSQASCRYNRQAIGKFALQVLTDKLTAA